MLEMARLFSKHRKHLGRSIRFAWWPGHEQGTYAGSTWYLDTFWDDIRDNATGYVAMDAIGRVGSLGFESKNTEEIRAFREHVIKEVLGVQVKSTRAPKSGDQSFWKMGLPSCILERTFTAEQTRTIEVDPVWYSHTAEDTLDKVDMEVIMPTFKVTATSILRLCNNPILPFDFAAVAGLLKNTLNALQKGSKSVLDLTSVIDQAEVLEKNVATLTKGIEKILGAYERKGSDASLEGKVKDINTCLMGLGRTLMPVLSSKAGRYGQDPMGIKFKPLPTLQSLEGLTSMDSDSEEYRALRTSLLRERNRVSDALDWANWILCETMKQ
jgi:hypothetical protein